MQFSRFWAIALLLEVVTAASIAGWQNKHAELSDESPGLSRDDLNVQEFPTGNTDLSQRSVTKRETAVITQKMQLGGKSIINTAMRGVSKMAKTLKTLYGEASKSYTRMKEVHSKLQQMEEGLNEKSWDVVQEAGTELERILEEDPDIMADTSPVAEELNEVSQWFNHHRSKVAIKKSLLRGEPTQNAA
ncbi:MAG: hypothetical protein M1829_004156 [Trizodia sp. TS-e1964]|nr:MAG: hypothetical protein M1829_004156 [Trizodia sp. TS-e1964]